jgi:hypothetical protein
MAAAWCSCRSRASGSRRPSPAAARPRGRRVSRDLVPPPPPAPAPGGPAARSPHAPASTRRPHTSTLTRCRSRSGTCTCTPARRSNAPVPAPVQRCTEHPHTRMRHILGERLSPGCWQLHPERVCLAPRDARKGTEWRRGRLRRSSRSSARRSAVGEAPAPASAALLPARPDLRLSLSLHAAARLFQRDGQGEAPGSASRGSKPPVKGACEVCFTLSCIAGSASPPTDHRTRERPAEMWLMDG